MKNVKIKHNEILYYKQNLYKEDLMKKIILYVLCIVSFVLSLVVAIVAMVDRTSSDLISVVPAQLFLVMLTLITYFEIRWTKK